jgi:hypothetical protein
MMALLTTYAKTEDEMKGGLLLNVIVQKSATVLELLGGKVALLLGRNVFLALHLCLQVVDGVRRVGFHRDGFSRDCARTEDKMG